MGGLADPTRLLAGWEAGANAARVERGAVLLHHAGLVDSLGEALDLPVGVCTALAARVYVDAFGEAVDGLLRCEACGEMLDVAVPLSEFDLAGNPGSCPGEATVAGGNGAPLLVRAPTSRDLVVAGAEEDPAAALLARCVRDTDGRPVDPCALAPGVRQEIDAAAEELAGGAAAVLRVTCPGCGAEVRAPLDIAGLLWQQVCVAAPAVLADIAELAAAFGWSEAEVLAMTPQRRAAYMRLARGGPA